MATRTVPDLPELAVTEEFGRRVVAARKAQKLSQWALARACKPSATQATISAIERGVGQSRWVIPVCRVLGLDPPVTGETDGMERWIAAGRLLQARAPKVFEYQLLNLEHLGASMAAPAQVAATPEKPRHH